MNLKEEILSLFDESIADNYLTSEEKKRIKKTLFEAAPDKRIGDLLRSELFDIARNNANTENYIEIINWIEEINKLILSVNKVEVQQESVYFSPGEECLQAILNQVNLAVKRIRICLFTISDDRISDALISRHKFGVDVKIISDNDKVLDKGSDIEALHQAGIPIKLDRTPNHMHHKFALFDDNITLTGSYNWTRSAEKYNHENVLITDSKKVLKQFNAQFEELWQTFDDF
jgi:phosphatidylserine/phosphatidylglycerophosphate/cardiolipin synthase-like enzyme